MTITVLSGETPTAQEILDEVKSLINDPDLVRWDDPFLIRCLNAAERAIVSLRPDTGAALRDIGPLDGGDVQTFSGYMLLDVLQNLGTDGATPGAIPKKMDSVEALNRLFPDRCVVANHPASATVLLWAYDLRDRTRFITYPSQPSTNGGFLRARVCDFPTGVAELADPCFHTREYFSAIVQFVLHYAYMLDSKFGDASRSQFHLGQFALLLGVTLNAAKQASREARQ